MLFSMLASIAVSALLALISVKAERNGLGPDPECQLVDCFELTIVEPKCASRNDVLWALVAFNNSADTEFSVAINRTENGKDCWWAPHGVSSLQDYQEVRHLVHLVKDPKPNTQSRTHIYKSSVPLTGTTPSDELPPLFGKEPKTATRMTVTISGCAVTGDFRARGSVCADEDGRSSGLDWAKKPK